MHHCEIEDERLVLEPKDKIKERLGLSPDIFEGVLIGYECVLTARVSDFLPTTGGSDDSLYKRCKSGVLDF